MLLAVYNIHHVQYPHGALGHTILTSMKNKKNYNMIHHIIIGDFKDVHLTKFLIGHLTFLR